MPRPALPLAGFAAALALAASHPATAAPQVVASIQPIHSLVAAVMEGVGSPHLLLRGAASPHTYALRPSDAERLQQADIVVWVGEELETFLRRPLAALAGRAEIVTLAEAPGLVRYELRTGGAWEAHEHDHGHDDHGHGHGHGDRPGHDHAHGQGHAHDDKGHRHAHQDGHRDGHAHDDPDRRNDHVDAMDGHIWLDPHNAHVIARAVAEALGRVDPANAETYAANARALHARLDALDTELREAFAPIREAPYVVFHDAYQYLERRYGLNAVGSITVSPDRMPGARRLQELHRRIGELDARCVFAEPQFEPRLVETVTRGTGARAAVLDPLGADLTPGPDAYATLMRNLSAGLRDCLARTG